MMPSTDTPPASDRRPVWGIRGTLAWGLVILAVMAIAGLVPAVILARLGGFDWRGGMAAFAAHSNPAWLSSLESIAVLAPVCAVIAFAVRRRGWRFSDYLALRRPARRHLVIGLVATATLLVASDAIARLMHWPLTAPFLVDGLRRDPTLATLALLATSLIVTTPLGEELVFRGFIYRGLAASRLGPAFAVIVSAVMFTAMHVQYDAIGLTEVLANGLLLGTMRAVSGSTLLTIAMHALVNAVAFIEAALSSGLLDRPG